MNLKDIHIRDPFILTDGDTYYLYGSRGDEAWGICTGLDVYKSKDLKEWSAPIEVFTRPENFWSDKNYWAPEVHKYNGAYYMLVSFFSDTRQRGTQILKSDSPEGPFLPYSDGPVTPADWSCLDGTLYIENDIPYMIFCHEWVQVNDGEMCAVQLSDDLKRSVGEPFLLFKASQLQGVISPCIPPSKIRSTNENCFVTDGPYMYKTDGGRLIMLWSSFTKDGYCEAISYSDNGSIRGNWYHDERKLFKKDGGHGMIFRDFNGNLRFTLHNPNESPLERPAILYLEEKNNSLYVK